MNILLVNTFYFPDILGGAEVSVQKLAEQLSRKGHKVSVLCTSTKDSKELINGVNIIRIKINNLYAPIESTKQPIFKKVMYRILDNYNILNIGKISNVIKELDPDIIHTNNIYGISPIVWKVARQLNIPIVHTLRDYYLLYPFGNLSQETGDYKHNLYAKIHRFIHRILSTNIDFVTAPSKFTLKRFLEDSFFRNIDKKVVFNAIDFNADHVEEWYNQKLKRLMSEGSTKFVYLGTLGKHKGVDLLLNAFHQIEDHSIELHIAGKGPLQQLVEKYSIKDSRISYHGFLNERQIKDLLLDCHILIVPSIWYEPFGRVVIDAYKYGLPVIGSDIGGISEIIKHQETGLLIKPRSTDDLVSAIKFMSNRNNIKKMLLFCKKHLDTFSIEEQVLQFEEIYKKVLLRREKRSIYGKIN
jgi:glycosyltransferase involved in cell wall biosynthesis